jgi:N-methylhydantoinase A/oxoprolinase/acetone carboxylase beta subunit
MYIGIDVGGTNTDAVLVDGQDVRATVKTPTTEDVTSGIATALDLLDQQHQFSPNQVDGVMVGTTHFVNALVEASRLSSVAVLRFGLPATRGLPPLAGWPERLRAAISGQYHLLHGGHEFDGRLISKLDPDELAAAVEHAVDTGAEAFAVSSVYSPVNAEFEQAAAEYIAQHHPGIPVSLSHQIGRIGLLERENATVINAALSRLAVEICEGLLATLRDSGISASLFVSQNDGTLMDVEHTRRYPVNTFASGPTNSMRGAAFLSELKDCMVIDIGGSTSDIGVLQHGFPREAAVEVEVQGVRTNFRMPDVSSIGLGGGSLVDLEKGGGVRVGPRSVGYRLLQEGRVFGGPTLTATDLVVAAGTRQIGDSSLVTDLDRDVVKAGLARIQEMLTDCVDRMRTSPEPVDLVAVGGGSVLMPPDLDGVRRVHLPEHFEVANAIGAAIAQVGGETDRIFSVPPGGREAVMDQARTEAVEQAIAAGADPDSVQIVEVDEVPLAYLPGNATRVRVKAVGDLKLGG